jgi:hypothetical protein
MVTGIYIFKKIFKIADSLEVIKRLFRIGEGFNLYDAIILA